jgi:hypothetical protein
MEAQSGTDLVEAKLGAVADKAGRAVPGLVLGDVFERRVEAKDVKS